MHQEVTSLLCALGTDASSGRRTWSGTPLAQARVSAAADFSTASDPNTRRAGRIYALNGIPLIPLPLLNT